MNRKSSNSRDPFRRNATDSINTLDETQQKKKKPPKTTLKKVSLHLHFKNHHPKLLTPMLTHLINKREKTTTVNLLVHLKSQQQNLLKPSSIFIIISLSIKQMRALKHPPIMPTNI